MGYSITIGQAEPFHDSSDFPELYAKWKIRGEHHEEAPAFGEPTDNTNQRWPSYTAWADFCEEVGLVDFFYEYNSFRGGHPGAFQINQDDVDMVYNKLEAYRKRITDVTAESAQWNLNRLIWLEYWMRWAVNNCSIPAIGNT